MRPCGDSLEETSWGTSVHMIAVRPIVREGRFQARTPTGEPIETQSMSVTFEQMRSCLGRKSGLASHEHVQTRHAEAVP